MVDQLSGVRATGGQPAGVAAATSPRAEQPRAAGGPSFATVLEAAAGTGLRFSAHAQERLRTRAIELTERDQAELAQAVDVANAKGARESLILIDDLALVVSIRNRVVITAMEREANEANVFTHIDSAILVQHDR